MANIIKIAPFLWFEKNVEEAVRFYVSVISNSSVDRIFTLPAESAIGPAGSVKIVDFTLAGTAFQAMEAGRNDPFNHAISFMITTDDQAEIDRLWDALGEGGSYEACGWLKDRYGVFWQIVPTILWEIMNAQDRVKARRGAEAMLNMVKFDIAELTKAFESR